MIKKRGGVYHYKFRRENETLEGSCHTANKRTAEQIEAGHKTNYALGKVGIGPKKKTPTFAEYATNTFMPAVRINKAGKHFTVTYYKNAIAHLLKSPLAKMKLDEIATADVTAHKGRMQKAGFSVSTINGSLRALKRLLNVACEADVIPKVIKIVLLGGANIRDFVLREADEAEYLAACKPLWRDVAILMLDMGFRPEELHQLTWPQIHGDSITIYVGKGDGSRRTVEITDRVIEVLTARGLYDETKRESPTYVFPAPTKAGHIDHSSTKQHHADAIETVKQAKAQRAGTSVDQIQFGFVPYSLRHTFCTKLAETGIDAPALMYICGHKNLATTMKYVHLASVAVNRRLREARLKIKSPKAGGGLLIEVEKSGDNSGDS
jgi:integrase